MSQRKSNLPFPGESRIPQGYLLSASTRRGATDASNAHIIERISKYKVELPKLLEPKIVEVREFFLTEIVPLVIALQAGYEDGHEVLKSSIGEEPDTRVYAKALSEFLLEACVAKMFSFIGRYSDLTTDELQCYLLLYVGKVLPGGDSNGEFTKALLLKVSTLLDMQGQEKKREGSQVRTVQGDKARSRRGLRGTGEIGRAHV